MNLTKASIKLAQELLRKGLDDRWQRLNQYNIKQLEKAFSQWLSTDDSGVVTADVSLLRFMLFKVDKQKDDIARLKKSYVRFSRIYLKAIDETERQQHILNFSAELGANSKTLRGDRKAFVRWFGRDAIVERYQSAIFERQRSLAFYLDRLGSICQHVFQLQDDISVFWRRLRIDETLRPLLAFDGDERVRVATFKCISRAVNALPQGEQNNLVGDATVQYIYRSALERRQDIWIQREALSLLKVLSTESLQVVLQKRITQPHQGDDIFVRRQAVSIIGEFQNTLPELQMLLYTLVDDPSPAVRQMLPSALLNSAQSFMHSILNTVLKKDESAAVRASVLLIIPQMPKDEKNIELMQELLVYCFENEADEFVVKTAFKVLLDCLPVLNETFLTQCTEKLLPHCRRLHTTSESLVVRRMAAQLMEWLWLYSTPSALQLHKKLHALLETCEEGHRVLLPRALMENDALLLGRVMSLLAQQDHGLTLEKGWRGYYLRRGERFAFRWWRFWHELRNSSTDKRQSHRHTIGRHYHGLLHAPSAIMSELAETRVPGEPLYITEENASRYYLPLVDQALAALDQGWPTKYFRIVSAEGVTQLIPPDNLLKRLKAHIHISSNFAAFARLRNWQISDGEPTAYIQALQKLGFKVEFIPHDQLPDADTSVTRFFPALLPFSWDIRLEKLEDYFFSVYENTLFHLGVFVVLVSGYFFGRHIYLNQLLRRARNAIPLVIGGWGTRGKSGTERLKAALFNALGYSVVSKTSGCEAMFLHAPAYGPMREMFLFRPYDKATIWEQVDVVTMSHKLGCDVFLWECMGLTPSYVHVLQRNWMRDDISTITNTYPDHEDLQGPAGYDIPRVMTNFIPEKSTLITSEEQMLPILRDSAKQLKTRVRNVGWLQAGLITEDILQRFPYEEHPYNIALVLEVADELGIERDFALKEIADKVVPDLGVLKTFPLVHIQSRQLEFINGMSANERFGALSNWSRMKLDQHNLQTDANIWVSTVINNRADRVARSQVFANIMVQDISVDRHILIGDNLQGLLGYIREAWQSQNLSLFTDDKNAAPERLKNIATQLRVPVNEQQIINRLQAMLSGVNIKVEAEQLAQYLTQPDLLNAKLQREQCEYSQMIVQQLQHDQKSFQQYQQLLQQLQQSTEQTIVDASMQQQAWQWFEKKLVVINDYYAQGDDVLRRIVEHTPPGLKNRVMGMQNIKGTGLDFIYRWQAWESCYTACENLTHKDSVKAEDAVKLLAQFQEFGVLCDEKVHISIENIKTHDWTQREEIQAELALIIQNLKLAISTSETSHKNTRINSGIMLKLAEYIEAFMDAGDAVKRRKLANQIYKDMIHKRISHERAAVELQQLNKRQKGGWGSEYLNQLGGIK
jgi:gamma-polyglutamate synthase